MFPTFVTNLIFCRYKLKGRKMIKPLLIKKVGFVLFLTSISLFCAQTQAAIISSFNSGVDVGISATFSENIFDTALVFSDAYTEGSSVSDSSGSGNSGPNYLSSNEVGTVSAAASGQVESIAGFASSEWTTTGFFYFENTTGVDVDVDVTFDVSWFTNIFTTSAADEAYATAGVYIEDSFGDTVFYDFIELDSLIEGPGLFSSSDDFTLNLNLTIADGDYEEYFLYVDSFGFAEEAQHVVPEPSGIFFAGLALLIASRRRKIFNHSTQFLVKNNNGYTL
jgi:hypothetical protein